MKKSFRLLFLVLLTALPLNSLAQKVKVNAIVLKYNSAALYSLGANSIPYQYQITFNGGQEYRPEIHKFNKSALTMQLRNLSIFYIPKEQIETSYKLMLDIGECHLENKIMTKPGMVDLQATRNSGISGYKYECTFNYPFQLVLKNAKDSILYEMKWGANKPVKGYFPDLIAEKIPGYTGFQTPADLESAWLKYREQFYDAAREKLVLQWVKEAENNLDLYYKDGTSWMNLNFYYLKDKKNPCPGLDSLIDITKIIDDSVSANFKKKNFRNWQTPSIQNYLSIAEKIVNRECVKFISQIQDKKLDEETGNELIMGLYKNRIAILLLQNRFEEGLKDIDVVLSKGGYSPGTAAQLEELKKYYEIEKIRYNNNKKRFNWN